jgi:hypothetical protein
MMSSFAGRQHSDNDAYAKCRDGRRDRGIAAAGLARFSV